MNQSTFMKLAEKAFAQLKIAEAENEHVSPVDLICELQTEMVKFAQYTNDEDDLVEMRGDAAFAYIEELN